MKSIKIKVRPADPDIFYKRYDAAKEELTWLWNEVRNIMLRNHAFAWYDWAEKRGTDVFGDFTFEGIIKCPLNFDRNSVWIGASCPIAIGGPRWTKSSRNPPIQYRTAKGEIRTKPSSILVAGDKPYRRIRPREHRYLQVGTVTLDRIYKFDSKRVLKKLRADVGLPGLTTHSDLIGGLLAQFEESWKAFLNVKQPNGRKPHFRKGNSVVTTLYNPQSGPDLVDGQFKIFDKLYLQPIDKNWRKRWQSTRETLMRSYQVVTEPSGLYLCISLATPEEALKPTLKRTLGRVKKVFGEHSKEFTDAKETITSLLSDLEPKTIKDPQTTATVETFKRDALLSLDGGQLFAHNESRKRVEKHINALKSRLSKMRNTNDRRLGTPWSERQPTQNEHRLSERIRRLHERSRNSRAHFNHKLSTRLARTYDQIAWVDNGHEHPESETRIAGIADLKTNLERKLVRKGGKLLLKDSPSISGNTMRESSQITNK